MILSRFFLALLVLTIALPARAQTNNIRVLSLEDCVRIALEHNLDVQISRITPEIAGYSLAGAYGAYDPGLSLSAEHSFSRDIDATKSETDSFGAGIGGALPWGMTYGFNAAIAKSGGSEIVSTNFPVTNTLLRVPLLDTAVGEAGFVSLRQPLLKDFWIDGSRLTIYIRKKDLQFSELAFRSSVMSIVTAVETAYYNLIFSMENVRVQQKGLELAERLVTDNRRRVEVGALAPLDEKQAESRAAASRADLLSAESALGTQQRVLKSLLSDNYDEWKDTQISPTESLIALPATLDLQESWQRGLERRPDLAQAKINLDVQTRTVRYQKNQVFPNLDLVGRYGYSGVSDDYSGVYRQWRDRDNPSYAYGAEVSIPLGNVSARNNYKAAKANRERLELQLKKTEQNVLIGIENSIADARTSLERVEATRQARLYAEEALKAEETKLEKGKSTSFVVLQLQRDLTAARSSEIRALADYNIAIAEHALAEGSTLQRRNIDLELK